VGHDAKGIGKVSLRIKVQKENSLILSGKSRSEVD
jgi:hypothetical protein